MKDPLKKYKIEKNSKNSRFNSLFNLSKKRHGSGTKSHSENTNGNGNGNGNGDGNGNDVNVIDPIDNTGGKF